MKHVPAEDKTISPAAAASSSSSSSSSSSIPRISIIRPRS
jgi:hypothetical protein